MYYELIEEFKSKEDYSYRIKEYIEEVYSSIPELIVKIYNTNAIEGNTLTYNDTKEVFENGEASKAIIDAHGIKSVQEVLNFTELLNLFPEMVKDLPDEEGILLLHYMLMNEVLPAEKDGTYRVNDAYTLVKNEDGTVSEFEYDEPELIQESIEELMSYVKVFDLDQIAFFNLEFLVIHPFADGNGRVSRLLLDWMLINSGYPPINITLEDRDEYLKALDQYTQHDNKDVYITFIQKKVYRVLCDIFK